jgi:hypothetical protein
MSIIKKNVPSNKKAMCPCENEQKGGEECDYDKNNMLTQEIDPME